MKEALRGQRPQRLCTPDPMDFTAYAIGGLEVGLGPAPLGCLRSSRGEVPQARAPPAGPEPALGPTFAGSLPCMNLKSFPCGMCLHPVAKGAPPGDSLAWVRVHGKAGHLAQATGCSLIPARLGPACPPCKGLSVFQKQVQLHTVRSLAQSSFSQFFQAALHLPMPTVPTPELPLHPRGQN